MTLPYVAHSEPSREAAVAALPRARRDRDRVLAAIRDAGERGLTDPELQRDLGLAGNTERPRRRELQQSGLIRDSGQRRYPPRGGLIRCTVWVAVWPGQQPDLPLPSTRGSR